MGGLWFRAAHYCYWVVTERFVFGNVRGAGVLMQQLASLNWLRRPCFQGRAYHLGRGIMGGVRVFG
jgi:hypothetical protein